MTLIRPRNRAEFRAPSGPYDVPQAPVGAVCPLSWAKTLVLAVLVTLVIGGTAGASGAGERLAGPLPAQVISVLDGDTLEVRVHIWLGQDIRTRVRLAGIDAPELKGKCARERDLAQRARAYLLARLDPLDTGDGAAGDGAAGDGAAASVRLREVRYGKYAGRVLARVETLDGTDLGQELVAAGLARPYDGRRRASWCEAAATADSGWGGG